MNRREFLAAIAAVSAQQTFIQRDELTPVTLTRQPYIQNIREDGTSILWAAPEPADGVIAYSRDGINFRRVQAGVRIFPPGETGGMPQFTQFRVDLTGLTPGTNYFYQLYMDSQFVTQGRFRTAGDGPFSFLVCGDTGQFTLDQARIASRLASESASFLVHVGDIAYFSGSYRDFQTNHFDVYKDVFPLLPYFPCPGNHEYMAPGAAPYLALHAVPTQNVPVADRGRYYSFDWGNVHFICLDSNGSLESAARGQGDMLSWLENDLRATRKFWRVVAFHHPPYAGGFYGGNDPLCSLARQYIVPILESYGVQLVLNGHEHSYQRSRDVRGGAALPDGTGTVYITSGGGGAALYPVTSHPLLVFQTSAHHYLRIDVSGTAMDVSAIRGDGAAIDRFSLRPRPALADISGSALVDSLSHPAISLIPSGSRTLIRVRGRSLAAEETFSGIPPAPTRMAGTSVTANGVPVPLIYVSSTQIWGQLPANVQLPFLLNVTNANGSVQANVG